MSIFNGNTAYTALFIPGKRISVADRNSRRCHKDVEWMLLPKYVQLTIKLSKSSSNIDLFATKINTVVTMQHINEIQE